MSAETAERAVDGRDAKPREHRSRRGHEDFRSVDPASDSTRMEVDATRRWRRFMRGFYRCHQSPANNALHAVTTPMGLLGFFSLVTWFYPLASIVPALILTISAATFAPRNVAAASGVFIGAVTLVAYLLQPGWVAGAVMLVLGFGGQDVAHWLTSEPTFQSTYRKSDGWWKDWWEHVVLLVPALLVTVTRRRTSPLRLLVARKAVLRTKLIDQRQCHDMNDVMEWVRQEQPSVVQSTHWWQTDLEGAAGEAFRRLAEDEQLLALINRFHGRGFRVDPVWEMNEVYVTGPAKDSTSDTVFYMGHVDGPWAVFPGARLYRCMLALNGNREVTTHFSMSTPSGKPREGYRLQWGDAVAFDFNRELHFITREPDPEQREPRVNLKLHFVAYPKSARWYGNLLRRLTAAYDVRARKLFLDTINPEGWWSRIRTAWILSWTRIFEWVVRHLGWTNLAFVIVASLVALVSGSLELCVAGTSFVHYGIYIGTLRETDPISFLTFRRDAMFFKALSMTQFLTLYTISLSDSWQRWPYGVWWSPLLVLGGLALAGWSGRVLGMNRTLFSAELGFDDLKRVCRFPYGWIPHPMILGTTIAIAGTALVPEFRRSFGWLIAGHLVCYALVLLQEIRFGRRPVGGPPRMSG